MIYDTQGDALLKTPEGDPFTLNQKFEKEYFLTIESEFDVIMQDETSEEED